MLTWHTYAAHFSEGDYKDILIVERVDLDARRIHDIVKAYMRQARYFKKNLEAEIYKDGQYFACAWGNLCGAGAIGFSGDRETRSIETW